MPLRSLGRCRRATLTDYISIFIINILLQAAMNDSNSSIDIVYNDTSSSQEPCSSSSQSSSKN